MSKHALRVFTEILDAECGERGITAWALCPGLVLTKLGLSERPTHPERALSTSELANVLRAPLRQPAKVKLGPQVLLRTSENPFAPPGT